MDVKTKYQLEERDKEDRGKDKNCKARISKFKLTELSYQKVVANDEELVVSFEVQINLLRNVLPNIEIVAFEINFNWS